MNSADAVSALSGLANEHRLAVYRLLVQAGPEGKPAGEIAEALELPSSSLSFHLAHLKRAGLVTQRRESRSLIYAVDFDGMNALVGYLLEDCCKGHPEICSPVAAIIERVVCCPPSATKPAKRRIKKSA